MLQKPLTKTQKKILCRNIVVGYKGSLLYPIYGSGEHRSMEVLTKQGIGLICSSSKNWSHTANYFFTFFNYEDEREEYYYSHLDKEIKKIPV